MKAVTQTIAKEKKVFACPECQSPEHSYGHLKTGSFFGPWYCNNCGASVTGTINANDVDIERHSDRKARTLVLLRLDVPGTEAKPVHIIVEGMAFYPDGSQPNAQEAQERGEYFYNQHTCPWNYLRLPIKEGESVDPHGLFVHQETILMPDGYDGMLIDSIEQWRDLFPSLRNTD